MTCESCLGGRHTSCTDAPHCDCSVCDRRSARALPPEKNPPPEIREYDPRLLRRDNLPELVLELMEALATWSD